MSTITMNYPDVSQVRQVSPIGRIVLLSSLVLVAITILIVVVSASSTDFTHQVVVSQNIIASRAVPVPTPSITEFQPVPSETLTISPDGTSEPSVVPVPVPTPPPQ